MSNAYELPLPSFFDPNRVKEMHRYVPYHDVEAAALAARSSHDVKLAATDSLKVAVLPIDVQLTFCDPNAQLYVAGRSGTGAIDDSRRTCEFIYKNARVITRIHPTMDTHKRAQIFHCVFWVDASGNHAPPATMITLADVESGRWQANPKVAYSVLGNASAVAYLQAYALHYVKKLTVDGKYPLMVWPYHAMLGGIEHAFVPSVHEAFFYHNCLREAETRHEIKGGNPLSENYAITHPEVLEDHRGKAIAARNQLFLETLLNYDMAIILGQAKSHCVAWTIAGILEDILKKDAALAKKIYLLEDCTSPVVIPQVDFTDMANEAFAKFAKAGMHVVQSSTPINQWPGVAAQVG
jgi:nicotinamidase-related amidase